MKLVTYPNARTFLDEHEAFLERDEAKNNLLLGLCYALKKAPHMHSDPLFMAIMDHGKPTVVGLQTPPRSIIIYGNAEAADRGIDLLSDWFTAQNKHLSGFLGEKTLSTAWGNALAAKMEGSTRHSMHTIVYVLERVLPGRPTTGSLQPASPEETDLIARWQMAFEQEVFDRDLLLEKARRKAYQRIMEKEVFLWEDKGQIVAMACLARKTNNFIAINGVYTPPSFRKRGYASTVVAHLSQAALDAGNRYCTLFADFDNEVTNRMYRLMGYEPVAEFLEVTVGQSPTD